MRFYDAEGVVGKFIYQAGIGNAGFVTGHGDRYPAAGWDQFGLESQQRARFQLEFAAATGKRPQKGKMESKFGRLVLALKVTDCCSGNAFSSLALTSSAQDVVLKTISLW